MATEFLKHSEKVEWSTRGLIVDVDVAFRHPRSSKPLFIIADMPHAVKTARNTLDASGRGNDDNYIGNGIGRQQDPLQLNSRAEAGKNLPRDLKFPKFDAITPEDIKDAPLSTHFDVMNLQMIRRVVKFNEGARFEMLPSKKFPAAVFELDRSSKMRVGFATAIFSNTAQQFIDKAMDQGMSADCTSFSKTRNLPAAENYGALKTFCCHMDRLVDIYNTRNDKRCTPIGAADDSQLSQLLAFAEWIELWRRRIKNCQENKVLTKKEAKSSFLPDETYMKIVYLTIGFNCMCRYFLTRYKDNDPERARWSDIDYSSESTARKIVARRLSQDIIEEHFAHLRTLNRGGSAGLNAQAILSYEQTSAAMRNVNGAQSAKANFGSKGTEEGFGLQGLQETHGIAMATPRKRENDRIESIRRQRLCYETNI